MDTGNVGLKQLVLDNRKRIVIAGAMLLSFVFGFSLALVRTAPSSAYGNSTPVSLNDQTDPGSSDGGNGVANAATRTGTSGGVAGGTAKSVAAIPVKAKNDANCIVKAKKKATGTSLYYVAGDISYNRVKQTDCFKTEAEAQAAGFKKAGG
jgi:pectate lyase